MKLLKLSKLQKAILIVIGERPYITISDLNRTLVAGGAETTQQTVSHSITRLETRGIVERLSLEAGRRSIPAIRRTTFC